MGGEGCGCWRVQGCQFVLFQLIQMTSQEKSSYTHILKLKNDWVRLQLNGFMLNPVGTQLLYECVKVVVSQDEKGNVR